MGRTRAATASTPASAYRPAMSASSGWKYGQTVMVTSARPRPCSASNPSRVARGAASSSGLRLKVCHPWPARATRAERGPALPADVHGRMGLLDRLGEHLARVERVELPLVGGGLVAPEGAQHLQVLVGAPSPVRPGHVQGVELLLQPPDADAEVDSPVGQPVEGGHLLGRVHRVALGQEHHGGAETGGGGVGGQERQGVEGLQQAAPRRGRDAPVVGVGVGGGVLLEQDHVLADPDGADPPLVGLGPHRGQDLGGGEGAGRGHPQVDAHAR